VLLPTPKMNGQPKLKREERVDNPVC
jgi:hypothetical protein